MFGFLKSVYCNTINGERIDLTLAYEIWDLQSKNFFHCVTVHSRSLSEQHGEGKFL